MAPQRQQRRPNPPRRLPCLLVKPRDTEADLPVAFEARGGSQEAEGGRAERVLRGERDASVVDTCTVGGVGGAAEGEVPFEEVVFEWGGVVVGGGA